jgi:hypothetical protein
MSHEALQEYLARVRPRYQKAGRRLKWVILTEFSLNFGFSRKHAIRLMNGNAGVRTRRPGPRPTYGPELIRPLKTLWLRMGQVCSKRMKAALPAWLPHYRKRFALTDEQAALLLRMSPATIDRLLKPIRAKRGLSTTQPPSGSWYKSIIPIQAKDWNVTTPGYMQGDTVAHCGECLDGRFVNSLTLTDVLTSWTENRATWGKEASSIVLALKSIEAGLPFRLHTLKFDSGSEFMNYGVMSYVRQTATRPEAIQLLRSRPYKKDDNCYVEQKNFTHVRELVGYDRLDVRECAEILDGIYRELWNPLQNFFLPAVKLLRKTRIGARLRKQYDRPRTPYERLLECPSIPEHSKTLLKERYESLDPFALHDELEKRLKLLFQTLRRKSGPLKHAA